MTVSKNNGVDLCQEKKENIEKLIFKIRKNNKKIIEFFYYGFV